MPVARLIWFQECPNKFQVIAHYKGPGKSEDIAELLSNIFMDMPLLVKTMLARKNIPKDLITIAEAALPLWKKEGGFGTLVLHSRQSYAGDNISSHWARRTAATSW